MFKRILVPTDGSALSQLAIERALSFAKEAQAHVTFFYGEPSIPAPYAGVGAITSAHLEHESHERNDQAAREILNVAATMATVEGVTFDQTFKVGSKPHELIIEAANEHHCDLIFMASHGRSGLRALLLGSVTTNVLAHSSIPVLVYRS